MELLQYWRIVRKSLWLILLVVALGLASSAVYTLNQPPQYVSSTTLLLNPSVPSALVPFVQTQVASALADSYTQLMGTRSFGESVVKDLPFPMSADEVAEAITTRLESNTLFFKITASMDTPERAQQLVGTVLKVFLSSNAAQQQTDTNGGDATLKSEMRQRLETKLQYLGDQITSYQEEISDLQAQPTSKERNDQLLQLRGQLVALQQSETDAIVAMAGVGGTTVAANTALVVDQPLPGRPVPSNLLRNLGLALSTALLIGVGLAFFRDYLDYTIQSPEYLEETLHITPLAAIGVVDEQSGLRHSYSAGGRKRPGKNKAPAELAGRGLVTLEHPKSPESESFRVLRTNIQFASLDKPVRTMVVTSSGPGEGKTFTASNLAIVIAQAGKRVVLVDTDLRKPRLHKLFGLPNTTGFTNLVLDDSVEIESVLQGVPGVPNLAAITSGPLPPNPSELLNSHQTTELMHQLAKRADVVIYDSPPAAVTDPMILATRVDAVVLVIGAGITRRDMVARIIGNLKKVGVEAVLPVLNRVKARDMQGYYYYYRYYGAEPQETTQNGHGSPLKVKVLSGASKDAAVAQVVGGDATKEE